MSLIAILLSHVTTNTLVSAIPFQVPDTPLSFNTSEHESIPYISTEIPRNNALSTSFAPPWLHAATFTLICYDVIIVVLFCWLWLCGHLGWMRRNVDSGRGWRQATVQTRRYQRDGVMQREMRRLGMI